MENPKVPSKLSLALARNNISLALALKVSVITIAVVAFYFRDLMIIFSNAISDESSTHLLIIPFMFAYILFRKRRVLTAAINQNFRDTLNNFDTAMGALLVAIAVLVYWYGSYNFTPIEIHMFTLPIFATGLILILFNRHNLRHLAVPILFLFFLMPPPTEILYSAGSALSVVSAMAANGITNLVGISTVFSANQYGSPMISMTRPDLTSSSFSVDIACSGIYSLIGFVVFSAFIAYIIRESPKKKLAILLMGIPLIIALNIFRITTLLIIGYNYGDAIALQIFHTIGGTVLMFIGTIILFGVSEKLFKKPPAANTCLQCDSNITVPGKSFCDGCGKLFSYPKEKLKRADLAKILSIAIVIGMLVSIQAPVFALTEGPSAAFIQTQTPGGGQGNAMILPKIDGYNLNYLKRDYDFQVASGQDASLIYAYTPIVAGNGSNPQIWVTVEVATAVGSLHRWETCLINYPLSQGYKPQVTQLDLRDIQTNDNPPILARYFAFQDDTYNQTEVVLYWYQTGTFQQNETGTSVEKNVKISLVVYPNNPDGVKVAEDKLLPLAIQINSYWQPIKSWTAVSIVLSQNGLTLSIISFIVLIVLVFYKVLFFDRSQKTLLKNLYSKIPQNDKLLLQTINNIKGSFTISTLSDELQKTTNTPAPELWLNQKLQDAEKAGFIEKIIANKNDTPIIKWKSAAKFSSI
jgi:exosortase